MINAEKFQKWFELPKADLAALAAATLLAL
jgi:hypothetical protein